MQRVSELEIQTVGSALGWLQFTKGHNSIKTVNGVMVLNLCISSDDTLYLYQVSRKYLKGFQVIERMQFVYWNFLRGIILLYCRSSHGTYSVHIV